MNNQEAQAQAAAAAAEALHCAGAAVPRILAARLEHARVPAPEKV